MDKESAKRLIQTTLGSSFSEENFGIFISNLLKDYEQKPLPGQHPLRKDHLIYEAYRGFIESFKRLGKYTDSDGRTLEVLIVTLCPEYTVDSARTRQRNFVAWYLENGRTDGTSRDAALVAFIPQDKKEWRFSLVRMEYELTRTEAGKLKGEKTISPAKRFSFLVGEGENTHTAQTRFVPMLEDDRSKPTLEDLSRAFSVETITEEFFEKYRELFCRVQESLDDIVKKDKVVKEELESKGIDTADFAKKLLGQIVFLYFIQKKGWLGVERDKPWGTGPKNFLRKLYDGEIIAYKNYYNDVLEFLFYDMLAVDKGEAAWHEKFDRRIPFLNGGLFEPLNDYDWRKTEIVIDDKIFSNRKRDTAFDGGDGILDVFDRYNFTVKEDEPLEKEVAIDPELLGKVFENLLEIKDRKSKGSYYTPREVVHYMCQESLVSYLHSHLDDKVTREDLREFVKYGELNVYNDARVAREGKETGRYSYKLPEAVRDNAQEIDRLLAEVKVCDPAVGSGAFPMGMINEIVRARWTLTPLLCGGNTEGVNGRENYDFKWHAVENSIYGVDLDPGAVEIAKLRLWLSLVVDEESLDSIQPLPNLDFKIMQGNSLLEEFKGVKLFDQKLCQGANFAGKEIERLEKKLTEINKKLRKTIEERGRDAIKEKNSPLSLEAQKIGKQILSLKKENEQSKDQRPTLFNQELKTVAIARSIKSLHQRFFKTFHKSEKERLRRDIDNAEWELIEATLREQGHEAALVELKSYRSNKAKPFFLWKLNFSEVFEEKGGFDIVIGNPPYGADGDHDLLSRLYPLTDKRLSNSYGYFMQLCLANLREKGILCLITPNTWLSINSCSELRRFLLERSTLQYLLLTF